MPLTLPLPDWVPWWAQLAILVIAILFGFAFLMMPFAVFGVKSRLEFLETKLEDIQGELRMLAMRLAENDRRAVRGPAPQPVTEEIMPLPQAARPRTRPVPAASATPSATTPPNFPREDPLSLPSRRPRESDDWTRSAPLHDDGGSLPRRPLRATDLRDTDQDMDRGERNRSEPTLRWPPR